MVVLVTCKNEEDPIKYEGARVVATMLLVGEPKSRIMQKHTFFAPERYTAEIFYTDSLNSA